MAIEKRVITFIDEVNKIAHLKDLRLMTLLLGIYSEYAINELIRIHPSTVNFSDVAHSLKLKILLSHNLLDKETYLVLKKLNDVRNEYAHNLYVNQEKITRLLKETPLNWRVKDAKALENIKQSLDKNPLDRFQKICITNIIFLFQRLDKKLP